MTDNYRVHALGHGDLPGIIFTHALGSTALPQGCAFGMLMPNGLPSERTKHLANGSGVRGTFKHFCGRHRGDPKLCSRITRGPCSRRSTPVGRDLIKEVDDE